MATGPLLTGRCPSRAASSVDPQRLRQRERAVHQVPADAATAAPRRPPSRSRSRSCSPCSRAPRRARRRRSRRRAERERERRRHGRADAAVVRVVGGGAVELEDVVAHVERPCCADDLRERAARADAVRRARSARSAGSLRVEEAVAVAQRLELAASRSRAAARRTPRRARGARRPCRRRRRACRRRRRAPSGARRACVRRTRGDRALARCRAGSALPSMSRSCDEVEDVAGRRSACAC